MRPSKILLSLSLLVMSIALLGQSCPSVMWELTANPKQVAWGGNVTLKAYVNTSVNPVSANTLDIEIKNTGTVAIKVYRGGNTEGYYTGTSLAPGAVLSTWLGTSADGVVDPTILDTFSFQPVNAADVNKVCKVYFKFGDQMTAGHFRCLDLERNSITVPIGTTMVSCDKTAINPKWGLTLKSTCSGNYGANVKINHGPLESGTPSIPCTGTITFSLVSGDACDVKVNGVSIGYVYSNAPVTYTFPAATAQCPTPSGSLITVSTGAIAGSNKSVIQAKVTTVQAGDPVKFPGTPTLSTNYPDVVFSAKL